MSDPKEKSTNPPRQPKQSNSPMRIVAFGVICILVVLVLGNLQAILTPFKRLSSILAPVTVGLVLAYLLNPILRFFEIKVFKRVKRRTVNRALSLLLSYLVLLALIAGMLLLVVPQLVDSINDLRTNGFNYITSLIDSINRFIADLPIDLGQNSENLINLEKLLTYLVGLFDQYSSSIMGSVGAIAGSVVTVIKNILVGIFVSIYLLLAKERLVAFWRRILRAFFSKKQEGTFLQYCKTANTKFGGFVVGKMLDSFMVGCTCALLFSIFKIPYPIMIAVVIGVTDFIPFFGPFLGAIPSGLIIFITSPSKLLLFAVIILVVQQIDGNIIAPLILGDHTGLSSLGVLISVTVMGGLLGFWGMLIGVPLAALIMAVLEDYTKNRLKKKGASSDIYDYYSADAFIRPEDDREADETVTMIQRFVRWVRGVENEKANDPTRSRRRSVIYYFRLGCFKLGYFFYRIFSMKPLPEDQISSIFNDIAKNGMKENRNIWRTLILTVCTLGIYPLYLIEVVAETVNITCRRDKKRTWGVLPFSILSVLTLGIYSVIWHCRVINRLTVYCKKNKTPCPITKKYYLLWTLPGLLTLVGPVIAYKRFLESFNTVCGIFNRNHTFPITREDLEKELAAEGIEIPQIKEQLATDPAENGTTQTP